MRLFSKIVEFMRNRISVGFCVAVSAAFCGLGYVWGIGSERHGVLYLAALFFLMWGAGFVMEMLRR